jgi:hypothetical protein
MKKKTPKRVVKKAGLVKSHASYSSHPKHLGQMEMLLLVVVVLVLLVVVGTVTGVLPDFWSYPKVLSAMVGR